MTAPTIEVLSDDVALASRAADVTAAALAEAIRERGGATIALAGGSTPRAMNALMSVPPRSLRVDWTKVRCFFGDERCVPPDDPDSNFRMNEETLLRPLRVAPERTFRMRGEDDPDAAAAAYDTLLEHELGALPRFDVVLLGMGPDGHTASLFPGTLDRVDDTRRCVHNLAPVGAPHRLTLTPHVLNAARTIVVTAGGAAKADAVAAVLEGPREPDRYPSQVLAPVDGRLYWLLDATAAQHLHR